MNQVAKPEKERSGGANEERTATKQETVVRVKRGGS